MVVDIKQAGLPIVGTQFNVDNDIMAKHTKGVNIGVKRIKAKDRKIVVEHIKFMVKVTYIETFVRRVG